jgi:hypothetical protein
VKADSYTKLLNAPNPTLIATYTGFVGGETPAVLGGTLGFTTNVPSPEQVGIWTITPSGLTSINYAISFLTGTLKIQYPSGPCLGSPTRAILQPINADTSSVFKQGSTVPAKFRVCDANGSSVSTPGLVVSFQQIATINGVLTAVNEPVDSTTPDTGFRWSATDQLWIFNMSTKNLSARSTGTWRVTLNDGSYFDFTFGLK